MNLFFFRWFFSDFSLSFFFFITYPGLRKIWFFRVEGKCPSFHQRLLWLEQTFLIQKRNNLSRLLERLCWLAHGLSCLREEWIGRRGTWRGGVICLSLHQTANIRYFLHAGNVLDFTASQKSSKYPETDFFLQKSIKRICECHNNNTSTHILFTFSSKMVCVIHWYNHFNVHTHPFSEFEGKRCVSLSKDIHTHPFYVFKQKGVCETLI